MDTPNTPQQQPPLNQQGKDPNRKLKMWNIIVGIIDLVLLLLLIFWPKQCGDPVTTPATEPPPEPIDTTAVDTTTVARDLEDRIDTARVEAGGEAGQMGMTLMWNEGTQHYDVDFDAHAIEPTGDEICYKFHNIDKGQNPTRLGGKIDVDMIKQPGTRVENILWPSMEQLADGVYRFFVVNYNGEDNNGFDVKIYVGNKSYIYKYTRPTAEDEKVKVADVTIQDHKLKSVHHYIQPTQQQ